MNQHIVDSYKVKKTSEKFSKEFFEKLKSDPEEYDHTALLFSAAILFASIFKSSKLNLEKDKILKKIYSKFKTANKCIWEAFQINLENEQLRIENERCKKKLDEFERIINDQTEYEKFMNNPAFKGWTEEFNKFMEEEENK